MKNLILITLSIIVIGCGSNQEAPQSSTTIVSDFLMDISSLEDIEGENGIKLFQEMAIDEADETINFSKDDIEDMLSDAKKFKHCVIVIEDHTIIKIKDFDDCKQSGSWGACMPFAEGYIKKGDLSLEEDYMNNIIGLPDSQQRTAYLFN